MGMKTRTLITVIIIGLVFLTADAVSAKKKKKKELPTEAPEIIIIETKGYKKDKKGPVKFQHIKHQEEYINDKGEKKIPCIECHHEYDKKKKNTWKEGDPVKKCGYRGCHNPKKKVKKVYKLQIAFHKNCKDCHKAVVKAKLKKKDEAPYKKCMKCMSKKK